MLQRREDYNLVECEMILNYFPHSIWRDESELGRLREGFYHPMLTIIKENIGKVDKRQFLSIFQGLAMSGENIFRSDLLNMILNSYVHRL